MSRLIKVKVHTPNPNSSPDTPFSSSDEDTQNSAFVVYDTTTIPFGKLKGKPHIELLKPENSQYKNWLINQSKNGKFYYTSTIKYLQKNSLKNDLDITSNDYIYLIGLQNPSDDEQKRIEYFEANLSNHFVKLN